MLSIPNIIPLVFPSVLGLLSGAHLYRHARLVQKNKINTPLTLLNTDLDVRLRSALEPWHVQLAVSKTQV